jgi:hypothetical protein
VLPACLRIIGRESARCLQLPEPRPPWYSSCPKRKLEGFLPTSTKTSQTRGTDWQSGSPGFGTELPLPPQRLEALGCADGTLAYREGEWAHRGHCPTHCGGAPGPPKCGFPSGANRDVNRFSTKLSDQWAHRGHCPTHCGGTPGSPSAVSPAQTIHGCRRRRESVFAPDIGPLWVPPRSMTIFPGYVRVTALQTPGWGTV